jgi:hypothetical protein
MAGANVLIALLVIINMFTASGFGDSVVVVDVFYTAFLVSLTVSLSKNNHQPVANTP